MERNLLGEGLALTIHKSQVLHAVTIYLAHVWIAYVVYGLCRDVVYGLLAYDYSRSYNVLSTVTCLNAHEI